MKPTESSHNTTDKPTKKANKKRPFLFFFILIYLVALIIIFLIVVVIPKFEDTLSVNSYIVKKGEISRYINSKGLIIKGEQVFKTPSSGKPLYKYEEGTKVRKGELLFEMTSGGKKKELDENTLKILKKLKNKTNATSLYAKMTGIISYCLDGYEKDLLPNSNTFKKINESYFTSKYKSRSIKNDYFSSGEILYKLVDNNLYYLICYINNNNVYVDDIHLNDTLTIGIGSSTIKAKLIHIYREKSKKKLVFQSDMYYKNLARVRFSKIKILLGEYSGLKIPNESIVRKDGYDGVYRITDAKNRVFVPVNILSEAKNYSIVSSVSFINRFEEEVSTINYYDNIVRNPR